MSKIFEKLDSKKAKDLKVLRDFIFIYCREKHPQESKDIFPIKDVKVREVLGEKDLLLCQDCSRLLTHAMAKLLLCSYDPKPKCKKCATHCYAPGYREKIQVVMKFSGLYMIKHGRVDLMVHYLS